MIFTTIVAVLSLTSSVPAQPGWRAVSTVAGARTYISGSSVSRIGNTVTYLMQVIYDTPRAFSDGTRYDRIQSRKEADCMAMTTKRTTMRIFMETKLVAEGPADRDARSHSAGTAGYAELRAVCFNEWRGN